MAFDVLKQQRRAAGRETLLVLRRARSLTARSDPGSDFGHPVGNLRNLQLRRNLFADAAQFAVLFQGLYPVTQVVVSQCRVLPNGKMGPTLDTTALNMPGPDAGAFG